MMKKENRQDERIYRHLRVRKKMRGTVDRPRINVFRSLKHIYAQIIDDEKGCTLVSASTLDPEIKEKLKSTRDIEAAKIIGSLLAKRALSKNIKKVVFDRSGYLYHGRIKALADSARNEGLEF
jgi:large subunit ribosomal protein L18